MKLSRITTAVAALALSASGASAQVTAQSAFNGIQAEQVYAGSDTFNLVMDVLLNLDTVAGNGEIPGLSGGVGGQGINPSYQGVGSSNGERYMLGVANSATPVCSLVAPSTVNVGCQTVGPMSRALGSAVCNAGGYSNTLPPAAGKVTNIVSEGLAVANDGLVIVGSNAGYQQYSTGACTALVSTPNNAVAGDYTLAAPASGHLAVDNAIPGTAYTLGAGALSSKKWQDVIRLVYTGCQQGDGACTTTVSKADRCSSPVRQALLDNYGTLFEGAGCGAAPCTQLRKAYRRDDGSGTTGVFLELIGVATNSFDAANTRRTVGLNGLGKISALSTAHPFCDGHDFEGVFPSQTGASAATAGPVVIGGDPIRRTCAAEDDICARDGKIGVVRAIVSTPSGSALAYPKVQCDRGAFALTTYFNSSNPVCPDGNNPIGGSFCFQPFFNTPTGRNFNCMNDQRSRPPGVASTFDGRVYNAYMKNATTGAVELAANTLPRMAWWRMNSVALRNGPFPPHGGAFAANDTVCQLNDATQNIGCLVGNTNCAWGFAGRETAALTNAMQSPDGTAPGTTVNLSLKNEAFSLNGLGATNLNIQALTYPFGRELFFNSVDGFENLTSSCIASGRTATYCADELKIANAFYNNTPQVQAAFNSAGFIPVAASICRGAASSTVLCGAVNTGVDANGIPQQVKTACLPN